MKIFYVYRAPRKKLYEQYIQGKSPSTFLYALPELKRLGYAVTFSDNAWSRLNIFRYILTPLEKAHQLLLTYPIGFQLHQAIALWPKYRNADVIITAQDSVSLPFLLLKMLGLLRPKLVCISGSIVSALPKVKSKVFLKFIQKLFKNADAIICYSEAERATLQGFIGREVKYAPLGVDTYFFKETTNKHYNIDVLAAGRDSFRDYSTLFSAVKGTPWKVVVACDQQNLVGLTPPANVKIISNATVQEMKKLYVTSRLVVIPMRPTTRTQGLVVFMEAAAMGKCIIASNVEGLRTAYDFRKYPLATLIAPQNPQALKLAITRSLKKTKNILPNKRFRDSISAMNSAIHFSKILESTLHES